MISQGPGPVTEHGPRGTKGPPFGFRRSLRLALELARRDVALHWRHTRLGALWGVLPPLIAMGALDLFLGRLAAPKLPSETPYSLFLYAGLLPWQFLARAGGGGANVFLSHASVLGQVRFPRPVLPFAHVLGGLPDLLLGSLVLAGLAVAQGRPPGLGLLGLVPAVGLATLFALALTWLLASLTVVLRDVAPAAGFGIQLLFVASPILYPPSAIEGDLPRLLLRANPVTGIVGAFRHAWLGTPLDATDLWIAVCATLAILALAGWAFHACEPRMTDLL